MKTGMVCGVLLACVSILVAAPSAFSGCCEQSVVALAPAAHAASVTVVKENKEDDGAWLGVTIQDLDESLRESMDLGDVEGVLVNGVNDESPAEKAGIEEGDVITAVDGKKVSTTPELVDAVRSKKPGTEVKITLVRDGKDESLKATLAERPDDLDVVGKFIPFEGSGTAPEAIDKYLRALEIPQIDLGLSGWGGRGRLGVYVQDLSDGLAEYFGVPEGKGVLVQDVVEDSPAQKAGIKAGDVIVKIGDERVADSQELIEAIGEMEASQETSVVVLRKGQETTLKATVGEDEAKTKLEALKRKFITVREGDEGSGERSIIVREISDENKELRKELDDLRTELKELRKELEGLKSR